MLKRESKERITSVQALNHNFFKEDNEWEEWKSDISVYKTNLRPSHLSRVSTDEFDK